MGTKGDKLTNDASAAAEEFIHRIDSLGDFTSKKMFGGYGIFESAKMFALVNSSGGVFLKVDDSNRGRFEDAGSGPHGKMPYYQIPQTVMEDEKLLFEWTVKSIELSKA